jgi:hypothetical protein
MCSPAGTTALQHDSPNEHAHSFRIQFFPFQAMNNGLQGKFCPAWCQCGFIEHVGHKEAYVLAVSFLFCSLAPSSLPILLHPQKYSYFDIQIIYNGSSFKDSCSNAACFNCFGSLRTELSSQVCTLTSRKVNSQLTKSQHWFRR